MNIKKILITLVTILILPLSVNAASGKISVTSSNQAVVGNKITVTVTLSSSEETIGSWQMNLNYNSSYLQLTSSTAEAGGTMMANSSATGVYKKSYTFTFKALKTGSTTVSVGSYDAYGYDKIDQLSLTSSSKTIKIITQAELEASYSKNNNLKSISVEGYEITPEFNQDTLEYSVVVPEDTKTINVSATAADSTATISGTGELELSLGVNVFQIVVKAQNGSEKTYTLNVDVKDANPIVVTINDKEYTVVKIREYLPTASAYQEHTTIINEIEIPAYKNEVTNITLVGLKDSEGNISLFIYDEDTQEYKVYNEIGINKITIYPLNTDKTLKGYTKTTEIINNEEVEVYKYNKDSKFLIIYGMNIENGEKGFYLYDTENQTITKYNDEYINDLNELLNLYTYIIIGFIFIFILIFIIFIIKLYKNKKRKKDKNINETHIKENKKKKRK